MKKECAWCGKPMGEVEGGSPDDITHGICEECLAAQSQPRFQAGDQVKIVRILDDITSRELIGLIGAVQEVDPLPNGDFNYYVDGHYMHEAELEAVSGGRSNEQPDNGQETQPGG